MITVLRTIYLYCSGQTNNLRIHADPINQDLSINLLHLQSFSIKAFTFALRLQYQRRHVNKQAKNTDSKRNGVNTLEDTQKKAIQIHVTPNSGCLCK
jgi:hypothetical protein